MEFRQLKTFKAVADQKGFTRAARVLNMAQSSVSAQVRALEEELSVRLFDRIGRQITITQAGKSLYDYARRMEEMTDALRSEVSGRSDSGLEGRLTIRVPDTLAAVYMPEIIDAYHRRHPGIHLVFMNCSDQRLREELNAGKIDLAFLMIDWVNVQEVNTRMLGTEQLILAAAPSHKLAGFSRIDFGHLERETLLLPKTD